MPLRALCGTEVFVSVFAGLLDEFEVVATSSYAGGASIHSLFLLQLLGCIFVYYLLV